MKRELFDEIFDREIEPFVEEMLEYEPFIEKRNLAPCKRDIYNEYSKLRVIYKRQVYNSDVEILDRHKVASCMCGAFLTVPIFHKGHLLEAVKQHGEPVESFFYYANEFIAFYAANKFLSFYMLCETDNLRGMDEADRSLRKERILRQYPLMPPASKVKETRAAFCLTCHASGKRRGSVSSIMTCTHMRRSFLCWRHILIKRQRLIRKKTRGKRNAPGGCKAIIRVVQE